MPPNNCKINVEDINHWILFLSQKRIKELTLMNFQKELLKLPTHLFSCLELKHLNLYNVSVHPSPTFCGFPNLLSLDLCAIRFRNYRCGELLAHCPLLENLSISEQEPRSYVKLVEIAKLENLKTLSLSTCLLDNIKMITSSSFFEHFSLLPKLQELNIYFQWCEVRLSMVFEKHIKIYITRVYNSLTNLKRYFFVPFTRKRSPIVFSCLKALTLHQIDFQTCKFLAEISAERRVSTTFPCLETITFFDIDFRWDVMVSCAFGMIFGSPNLQNLYIMADFCKNAVPPPTVGSTKVYDTMGQLQLQNVKFVSFRGTENEVGLIKDILACSPLLKKVEIRPSSSLSFDGDAKYMFARKLLKLHRASPIVEIDLE